MISNAEFFLEGGRAGVLLIHGLTGTPNEMRLLGRGLHRAGFTVHGMQLAGHCGSEQDLVASSWQDWYHSVEVAAENLRQRVDHVFVGGLSMGALLALKLAVQRPGLVAGLGIYGPTFRYDGWSMPRYARHCSFLLHWFRFFRIFQHCHFTERTPYGLKDERLRAVVAASMQRGDSTAAGLAGNPFPALADMLTLSASVQRQLSQVQSPCLIMHARDDDIADIRNALLVQRQVRGPTRLVVLKDSYHMITIDRERREVVRHSVAEFQDIVRQRLQRWGRLQDFEALFPLAADAVA